MSQAGLQRWIPWFRGPYRFVRLGTWLGAMVVLVVLGGVWRILLVAALALGMLVSVFRYRATKYPNRPG